MRFDSLTSNTLPVSSARTSCLIQCSFSRTTNQTTRMQPATNPHRGSISNILIPTSKSPQKATRITIEPRMSGAEIGAAITAIEHVVTLATHRISASRFGRTRRWRSQWTARKSTRENTTTMPPAAATTPSPSDRTHFQQKSKAGAVKIRISRSAARDIWLSPSSRKRRPQNKAAVTGSMTALIGP
jgi:hypothetical protein